MRLGRQTGLPRDVTHTDHKPSQAIGFAQNISQPSKAQGQAVSDSVFYRFNTYTYNSQATVQRVLGASVRRKYLLIQNNGTVNLYVGFGAQPNLNGVNALLLPPNAGISFDNGICPNNDIYIVSTIQCPVTVLEGLI